MSESTRPYNEIDDYIATFSDEERQEYVAAEMALDGPGPTLSGPCSAQKNHHTPI